MTRLIALLLAQAGGAAWLAAIAGHRMTDLLSTGGPLSGAPLPALSVVTVHVVAALAAVWLLACTGYDTVAALLGGGPVARSPKWVRRIIDNAVGTALIVGLLAGPASAAVDPPSEAQVMVSAQPQVEVSPDFTDPTAPPTPTPAPPPASVTVPVPVVPPGPRPVTAGTPTPAPADDDPAERPPAPSTQTGEPTHEVAAGENLWVIARAHLLADDETAPTDREVHAYWVRLIGENVDVLRSGNPDLIFPGEVLRLPAADGAAA